MPCCQMGNQAFTYKHFKDALESTPREQVKDAKPEVWVTIKKLEIKGDLSASFPLHAFSLKDCECTITMAILGSNLHIVQELGSEIALKLMDKVGVIGNTRRGGSEFMGQIPPGRLQAQAKEDEATRLEHEKVGLGKGGWEKGEEMKSFEVQQRVTCIKDEEEDQVRVVVQDMVTTQTNGNKLPLKADNLRKHVEIALQEAIQNIVTEQAKKLGLP